MKTKAPILMLLMALFMACENKQTLQEFYVEKQSAKDYNAIDLSTNLLLNDQVKLAPEERKTLETIEKINILAFPLAEDNQKEYVKQKEELQKVFKEDDYNSLFKYKSNDQQVEFFYQGDDQKIDEFIVVGFDDQTGFAVARVLGNDMDPGALVKLFKSIDGDNINESGLEQVSNLFKN